MGVIGLALTRAIVRESRDPAARRLDPGRGLAAAGLFCVTFGLVQTERPRVDLRRRRSAARGGRRCCLRPSSPASAGRRADGRRSRSSARRPFARSLARCASLDLAARRAALRGLAVLPGRRGLVGPAAPGSRGSRSTCRSSSPRCSPGGWQRRWVGAARIVAAGAALGGPGHGRLRAARQREKSSGYLTALPSYVLFGVGYGLAVPGGVGDGRRARSRSSGRAWPPAC